MSTTTATWTFRLGATSTETTQGPTSKSALAWALAWILTNTSAWGDYDSDGDLDIATGSYIYRNDGNWSFAKIGLSYPAACRRFGVISTMMATLILPWSPPEPMCAYCAVTLGMSSPLLHLQPIYIATPYPQPTTITMAIWIW